MKVSWDDDSSQLNGKIKFVFQTTNQKNVESDGLGTLSVQDSSGFGCFWIPPKFWGHSNCSGQNLQEQLILLSKYEGVFNGFPPSNQFRKDKHDGEGSTCLKHFDNEIKILDVFCGCRSAKVGVRYYVKLGKMERNISQDCEIPKRISSFL